MWLRIAYWTPLAVASIIALTCILYGLHLLISLGFIILIVSAAVVQWRVNVWSDAKRAELQKLALVASETNDSVVITDTNGYIEWVNQAFTKLTGYEAHEVLGLRPGDFLQGSGTDQRTVNYMRTAIRKRKPASVTILNYDKDGRPYWVEARIQPVFEGGRLVRFFSIQTDVTQRIENERKLNRALEEAKEASRAKTRFLATMSHELRTPLNAVNGYAQMMEGELLGPLGNDRYKSYVSDILSSGTYLLELIESILNLSDLDNGTANVQQELVDVQKLFDEVRTVSTPRANGMDKPLHIRNTRATVVGDNRALKQVLINLVDNALKYSHPDSTVTVYCGKVPEGCQLTVEDDGPGISEEDIPRITDAFYRGATGDAWTAKPEGTGIGLSLVKEYVKAMGGEFELDSLVGVGTRVHIRLPEYVAPEAPVAI
jgi:PAS domain S-box-containing protein